MKDLQPLEFNQHENSNTHALQQQIDALRAENHALKEAAALATEAEREACAKVADYVAGGGLTLWDNNRTVVVATGIAAAIRARGTR